MEISSEPKKIKSKQIKTERSLELIACLPNPWYLKRYGLSFSNKRPLYKVNGRQCLEKMENLMSICQFYQLMDVYQFIDNKAKGRISKRVFEESKARQNFRKTNISYLLIRTWFVIVDSWLLRYGKILRIQSECGKIQTRITPNTDAFHAVKLNVLGSFDKSLVLQG